MDSLEKSRPKQEDQNINRPPGPTLYTKEFLRRQKKGDLVRNFMILQRDYERLREYLITVGHVMRCEICVCDCDQCPKLGHIPKEEKQDD